MLVFKDLEPGLVVKAFTFECDLRIGGGTARPADGFSINYARASDPIVNDGWPFAGTSTETNLPEEGSLTGLGIGFDTWQSGDIVAGSVIDCVGISVRVDGNLIAQLPVPLQPGNVYTGAGTGTIEDAPYRNLAKTEANYAKSMQTGALSSYDLNGDGVVDANDADTPQPPYGDPIWGRWIENLKWEPFVAELTENSKVKITWKGVELTPSGGLPTTFSPSPGRLVFGGRTGGAWEVTHIDNIVINTITNGDGPTQPPATIQGTVVVSPVSALADGESAVTVTVTLVDGTGQPLAGKAIKVSAPGTTMAVSITQPASPTDANGRATATLTSLTPGTVLVAATDVTDGIPLSQQSQQPLVTFTANLVPPNDDLRQAIASLFDDTVAGMKANAVVGRDAGEQGDAFRANLFADAAGVVLDALVGVVNLASGVSHSAKFAGLLAEPGLEETGAGALITDPAKLSYLFDTELIHGELTSRVLESVFRSVLATTLKKGATKLGVEGIKDGLRQIAAQDDGLSQIAENARKSVDLFEQSLRQRKEPLLSGGIPPLSTAQQTAWANDLDLRGETWLALANVLSQQDHFLQQFTAARATSSADAFEWFLQKLVVQATATVLFDGPGVLVTGGLFLVLDERQDLLNLSSDQTGYQIAFSTLGGVIQRNNELYLNAASAYTELAQARLATPVIGEVGQMSDLEEGHAWKLLGLVPKFSEARAYSQVNIRNTSPGDATFEVFVLWGYASSAFNVSIPDLAQVSIGVARIPAQTEAPVGIIYKNGSRGAEPDAATSMTVFVLGNNESGTFYVGRFSHNWSPTQTEAVGEAYARSGLYSSVRPMDDSGSTNALPAMENPVSIYVTRDAETQTYQGQIFVVNPFDQSYYAIVTQALPTGATVTATDGTLANSTIVWTNSITAGGLAKDSFTFRLPLSPGAATNLPPAMVTFTDTVDTSEPLVSDEPGFTGLFPVKVTGSIPLGTPGTNATMLVTITNLTAFAQSGTFTLTLTNAALAFGTNLAQPFMVATASATNLSFSLPGNVPAGQYAVTGLLSMNGGSGQVLAGVYTMPALPFSLSLGLAPVWSTNGLSLALAGPVGSNYLIQASTDLANWTPVRYFAITNSPFYFNDATATNSEARFYRAVWP